MWRIDGMDKNQTRMNLYRTHIIKYWPICLLTLLLCLADFASRFPLPENQNRKSDIPANIDVFQKHTELDDARYQKYLDKLRGSKDSLPNTLNPDQSINASPNEEAGRQLLQGDGVWNAENHSVKLFGVFSGERRFAVLQTLDFLSGETNIREVHEGFNLDKFTLSKIMDKSVIFSSLDGEKIELSLFEASAEKSLGSVSEVDL